MGTALTIYWLNLFSHRDVSQTALKASSMEYIPHDRRNMEPPDVQYRLCGLLYQNRIPISVLYLVESSNMPDNKSNVALGYLFMPNVAIRLRGSGPDPNNDRRYNQIPYLDSRKFFWNGLPCIDFNERIYIPIQNGLGSISMKGATLLQTVRQTAPGSLRGIPTRAAATQDQRDADDERNVRAFSCIMNYISTQSMFYKRMQNDFNANGIRAFRAMMIFGNLGIPVVIRESREELWIQLSYDGMKFPYTQEGYFQWWEAVEYIGSRLNKDGNAKKTKFVDGLPSFFSEEKAQMTQDKTNVYPATYGGIPEYVGTPMAANAHPHAGQPWIWSLAKEYFEPWIKKSSTVQKRPPKGLVRIAEAFNMDLAEDCDEQSVHMAAENITASMKCDTCGLSGHTSSFYVNGVKFECAAKVMKKFKDGTLQTPSQDGNALLEKSRDYKSKYHKNAKEIETLRDEMENLKTAHAADMSRVKKQYKRSAKSVSDADTTADSSAMEATEDSEEDGSDESMVHSFVNSANLRNNRKFNKKKH